MMDKCCSTSSSCRSKTHATVVPPIGSTTTTTLAALCMCSFLNAYLAISIFPYAGFMVLHLLRQGEEEGNDNDNEDEDVTTKDNNIGTYAGLLSSSYMVGRTLSAYGWGKAADMYGRTFVLKTNLLFLGIFSLFFGTSSSLPMAILWRLCLGLSNGLLGVIKTIATELAETTSVPIVAASGCEDDDDDNDKAVVIDMERKTIGLVIGMRSWGYLLSPAIGGLLAEPMRQYPQFMTWLHLHQGRRMIIGRLLNTYPFLLPNVMASIGCCVAFVFVMYFVYETLPHHERRNATNIPRDVLEWISNDKSKSSSLCFCQRLAPSCFTRRRQDQQRHSYEELKPLIQSDKKPIDYTQNDQADTVSPVQDIVVVDDETLAAKEEQQRESMVVWGHRHGTTRRHLVVHWMFAFVSMCADEMFPLFCMSSTGGLGLSESSIGKVLSGAGLLFATSQYAVYSTLVQYLGEYTCLTLGSILGIQPSLLIPLSLLLLDDSSSSPSNNLTWSIFVLLGVVMAVCKLFGMLYFASLTLALNRTVPTSQRGTMNGLVVMGASMARSVAPTFAGALTTFAFSSTVIPPPYGSLLMYGTLSILGTCVTRRARRLRNWRDNSQATTTTVEMERVYH